MIRPWTGATKLEWIQRRDAYRKSKSLPALASIRNSSDGDDQVAYKSALDAERGCLLDRMDASTTKNECWPLDKHPLREYRAPFAGELFLPLSYRQKHGVSQVRFHEGDDLNRTVYVFYNQKVTSDYPGVNFVTQDGLTANRHEFLGPLPHVVGFQFSKDLGEAYIEWWDSYTEAKWVGTSSWDNEVYFDKQVDGWVSKDVIDVWLFKTNVPR